ncbi:hypothetical protein H2198_009360 [Neophaeococcomyces mojaviensis]|uniref:Uncharacterized protein n=1 Tax=Neophaeococcomyces mojaviensis TaxID=3383035 RepID=A0ACC2ZUU7_9EURO|nr:hypothetical protein H2198_009360 [Knufia sp. JES_112]
MLQAEQSSNSQATTKRNDNGSKEERGAMSRRLAEMAEETMDTGSKSDRKLMSDAGFSDDLKQQLEERIAQTALNAQHQQTLSQVTMPSAAGKGTRDQAAAPIWTGNEALQDSALRMLDDSHKRIRMPARKPTLGSTTTNLRTSPKQKVSAADRLVNARDKTSMYALQQQNDMTEKEKEEMRKILKDRFSSGARPMPTTLQGLTSLANERIEDAIARGQFKNIQRGKGVNIERDHAANSPFLDTTEYFMNKIIQKQEIVPPWIEKQQELMKMVNTFRMRLRSDWRRHAARVIASKGGSVDEQVRRARAYALAEERVNPRPDIQKESMSSIDPAGNLTRITVEERIAAGVAPDPAEDPIEIKVTETVVPDAQADPKADTAAPAAENMITIQTSTPQPETLTAEATIVQPDHGIESHTAPSTPSQPVEEPILPMAYPFRDPDWERTELAYHTLAISEINALARSYNLMAPKIAQKPYYTLSRELNRCYADVAPALADAIRNRSVKGRVRVEVSMHKEGSILEKFQGTGHVARVRDEPEHRGYGFKEFWRDLFRKEDEEKRKQVV